MATVVVNEFLGVVADDNAHSTSPPGSLETAKNVVFRRQNIVEPRPGFDYFEATTLMDEGGEA